MAKEKFGVAVDEEIVREVDELVAECDILGGSGSEVIKTIRTTCVQSFILVRKAPNRIWGAGR